MSGPVAEKPACAISAARCSIAEMNFSKLIACFCNICKHKDGEAVDQYARLKTLQYCKICRCFKNGADMTSQKLMHCLEKVSKMSFLILMVYSAMKVLFQFFSSNFYSVYVTKILCSTNERNFARLWLIMPRKL